ARGEWTNLEENSLAGFDPDGLLRAYGVVTEPEEGDRPRSFLEGGVDPDERHRGVGSAMLGWQVERARELLAAAEGEGQLNVHVEDDITSYSELVERHGFVHGRYHTEMRRDLRRAHEDRSQLPRPLELVPLSNEPDDAIRLSHGETFGPDSCPP